MFTKKITESDAFLEMPLTTQCLYFHLNMYADDDGFVNNPKRVMRVIGSNDDDLKVLISKNFILVFESGVIVIKHWRMHNTLQNDRYHPTDYQEEYAQLGLKENKSYTRIQNGNILETEHNITKHNITKHNERVIYKDGREIDEDIKNLEKLGLTEEAYRIAYYMTEYTPTEKQYEAIKEAVFDPKIKHLDQYVEAIMKG